MSELALQRIKKEKQERTGKLDLSHDKNLTELPEVITELSWLQMVDCSDTKVSDLTPLANLTNLLEVDFWMTQVSDLAPLANLTNLQAVICWQTQVTDLTPLANIANLQAVDCSETQVSDIRPLIHWLKNGLNVLFEPPDFENGMFLDSCPLIAPPVEFAREGHDAVMEYFDQLGEDGENLNELKIIFLGEGASGKTSLIRRLRGEAFNAKENQTHGIRIRQTPFEIGTETITAHLWDFGGQEVMHATHQFFLAQRCIYVLVLNSRTDDKAEYWLKHTSSFGGKSPVLVVLNKIDENPTFEVNRKILSEKYPQIKGYYRLSCQNDNGIENFQQALREQISRSDTCRTPFPVAWLKVKNHFTAMTQDYIESTEFRQVCTQNGVDKPFSQEVLLQFLHDLGVIINFRNLANFDTQILNPLWLTNGVYRIINSQRVSDNHGLLHENDVDAVINDPRYAIGNTTDTVFHYPRDKLLYIVRVMQEFELCFPLEGNRYVVPQLLPVAEPDFTLNGAVLHFVVSFPEFLPDSILPRLMVKLHPYIKDKLHWRSGMVLSKPTVFKAEARIRADKEDKTITIDAGGEEPRRLLSFIRETLKEIIDDFTDLPFEERVPIPDSKEFWDYQWLVEMEKAGETEFFVPQVRKRISVANLLAGVEEPSMRDAVAQLPVKAFISYSSKDHAHMTALQAALSPLVRLNSLKLWHDRDIDAGEAWEKEIMQQLAAADIVLCLVSQDFINSDFCYKQEFLSTLKAHDEGKQTIVPIRLRSCAWDDLPLAKIQGRPNQWITSSSNQDEAWTEVAKELKSVIEQSQQRRKKKLQDEKQKIPSFKP